MEKKKNQIWNIIWFLYHYNHSKNHGEKKIIFTVYLPNFLLRALLCVHNQIGFRNFT